MNRLSVSRDIAPTHPAFPGHFPGDPILPGALLLAQVQAAACDEPGLAAHFARAATLASAKFFAPVRPGDHLEFALDWDDAGLRFEVRRAHVIAARGEWRWQGGCG